MKYINPSIIPAYIESNQTNPLRWIIGTYDKEQDCFTALLTEFRCRDYFNDIAYLFTVEDSKFQNTNHKQYGFPVGTLPYDKFREAGGIYLLLKNTVDKFQENVQTFLQKFCEEHSAEQFCEFAHTEHGVLCFIPKFYLEKTYRISLLTYLIRICNIDAFPNEKTNLSEVDRELWNYYSPYFDSIGFFAPEEYAHLTCVLHTEPGQYNPEGMNASNAFQCIHDYGYYESAKKMRLPNKPAPDLDFDEDEDETYYEEDEEIW